MSLAVRYPPAATYRLTQTPPHTQAILTVLFAVYSDKLRIRFPFILLGQLLTIIGLAILLSDVSSGVRYFGTFFCIGGPYAAFPGVIAWYVFCIRAAVGSDYSAVYSQAVEQYGRAIQTRHRPRDSDRVRQLIRLCVSSSATSAQTEFPLHSHSTFDLPPAGRTALPSWL